MTAGMADRVSAAELRIRSCAFLNGLVENRNSEDALMRRPTPISKLKIQNRLFSWRICFLVEAGLNIQLVCRRERDPSSFKDILVCARVISGNENATAECVGSGNDHVPLTFGKLKYGAIE